ncbi:MAG: response regulator [Deltaproteobacteria bacterium]|nr:response regulator [Deltaproteobacteria bacterium]
MKRWKILVVDDEPQNLRLMEIMLTPLGYDVHLAESGVMALQRIESITPDLILLDVMMPDMDGFQVLERLKNNDATRIIPIVMVTGLGDREDRLKGLEAGADDFVQKPVDATELKARVRSLLRVKAYQDLLLQGQEKLEREVARRTEQLSEALEEINRAAAAAEAANVLRGEFLANISHELRTPLNGIVGMTELVLSTDLTEEQQEYMEMVQKSADRLLDLIDKTLDFSEIETGVMALEPAPLEVSEWLDDIARMLLPKAMEKGVALNVSMDHNLPEWLIGDAVRLRQVLVNLAGNAIKFTEEGEVNIRISLESDDDGLNRLLFEIRDTGIGIPAEHQERIFDAFTQVDSSSTRRYEGIGLGLSLASRLVDMMNGRIGLESREGEGSRFWFSVPMAPK